MSTVTDLESYQQFALQQQAQNNAWSAEQAQKQMDFQREMSNTAHQREVKDLQAAGLNPILSVNSGASVPNGAQAEGDKTTAANVGNILQQVLQAQSAREVAAMYNAATINAAQIAANASMYATDTQAETKREYPDSLWGIVGHAIGDAQNNSYISKAVDVLKNVSKVTNPSKAYINAKQLGSNKLSSILNIKNFKNTSWYRALSRKDKAIVSAKIAAIGPGYGPANLYSIASWIDSKLGWNLFGTANTANTHKGKF